MSMMVVVVVCRRDGVETMAWREDDVRIYDVNAPGCVCL